MRQRLSGLPAVLLLVVAPLAGPVASAQHASAAVEDCPAGSVCVWTGSDFSGPMAQTSRPTTACVSGVTRSAVNRASALAVLLWENSDCSGESATVEPGGELSAVEPWRSIEIETVREPNCLLGNVLCT